MLDDEGRGAARLVKDRIMLTLCVLILAGFAVGCFLRLAAVTAARFLVSLIWLATKITHQEITAVDLLMLFAYLSALQGGFLIGAYAAARRSG